MADTQILLTIRPDQLPPLRALSRGRGIDKLVQAIVDEWLQQHDQAARLAAEEARAAFNPYVSVDNHYDPPAQEE
jgi:hypothetical protein